MSKDGRRRIEAAALELFATVGVDRASTRDIAHRAGVAEGTLYRHFRTKEELAETLFISFSGRLTKRLERAVAVSADPAGQIEALVAEFYRFADEEPMACDYVLHRHPSLQGFPPGLRLPKDVVVEAICRGASSGVFGPIDPILGAALVVGMIARSLLYLKSGLLKDPVDVVRIQVARAAVRVLKEVA